LLTLYSIYGGLTMELILQLREIPPELLEFFEPLPKGVQSDAWLLGPEPQSMMHFATFPSEIPRRAIKAGTSEKGCCPECGKAWVRMIEKSGGTIGKGWHNHQQDLERGKQKNESGMDTYRIATKGWQPQCQCNAPHDWTADPDKTGYKACKRCTIAAWTASANEPCFVPCLVLDPFAGSGTSLSVAVQLGRRAIGLELSPEYVRLAERRMAKEAAGWQSSMSLEV
jgi:hypothetical protein